MTADVINIMGGQGGKLSYGFHIYKDDDEVVQHLGLTLQAEAVSAILCVNHFVLIQVPCPLPGFSSCSITTNPHLGMENAFN